MATISSWRKNILIMTGISIGIITMLIVFAVSAGRHHPAINNDSRLFPVADTSKPRPLADTAQPPRATDSIPGSDSIRHNKKIVQIRSKQYDVVLIGNSIIQTLGDFGGKYQPLNAVWAKHFSRRNAINLGYSGYRTENIIWNLRHGELAFKQSPKLFILLIGTNNLDERRFKIVHTPAEVYKGTEAIVQLIRQQHPSSKIIVLRIFPRGGDDEKGAGKDVFHSSKTCIANAAEAGLLTKQLEDNENIFWVDAGSVFLLPNGKINAKRMPDLLHPNAAGAEAWVNALEPLLKKLLTKKENKLP